MMAHTRQANSCPTHGQVSWTIAVAWLDARGWLPCNPQDCEWFRDDGQHHVCVSPEGDTCPDWVACGDTTIECVRGCTPG